MEVPKKQCAHCKEFRPETLFSELAGDFCVYCKAAAVEATPPPPPKPVEETVEQKAQRELAQRQLARKRLLPFVERFNPDYAD